MKARKFNLRGEACYYYSADQTHKWKVHGKKSWIINYHSGESFNTWVLQLGVTTQEMDKRHDWIKCNADKWLVQQPKLPL